MNSLLRITQLAVLCGLIWSVAGCDDDDADTDGDSEARLISGPDMLTDMPYHQGLDTADGPDDDAGPDAVKTENHTGWQLPNCWRCHAGAAFTPAQCVPCHGPNGASVQPSNHRSDPAQFEPCEDCHGSLHFVHDNETGRFTFEECTGCHPLRLWE
jgi:hypothetical protein